MKFDNDYFEECVEKILGDKIREDDDVAKQMWSALANVTWYHPEKELEACYSFRAAGDMIARIREEGDYLDWYCCGPYAEVSDLIAYSMKKMGWIYDNVPDICDEPGCINEASYFVPSPDGRIAKCSKHSPSAMNLGEGKNG